MIDPKFEIFLGEAWERNPLPECRDDPFEAFLERREIEKALRHNGAFAREPYREPCEVNDFREFVKAEKQKIAGMSTRDMRKSAAQVLRKAADALAAI